MAKRRTVLAVGAATALVMLAAPLVAQPTLRPKRLVFIHGRSQQGRDPEAIKAEWIGALQEGARVAGRNIPGDIEIVLPFYGNKLDEYARQWDVPLAQDIQTRGSPGDDEFVAFQGQVAEQLRIGAGISNDQVDKEYGTDTRPRGPLNWGWVQAILRALDRYGPGISKDTVETFTRDVFLYTTRAGVMDEIDRVVGPAITEAPTVIVSHSLGSVVAYNILRTDRRALQVPLLVTVGSPLGLRAIRDQFAPLRYPRPPLGNWYNAFDTRDAIALFPLDATNFPVTPSIENNGRVRNQTENRHGIVGYLNDREVAEKILGELST